MILTLLQTYFDSISVSESDSAVGDAMAPLAALVLVGLYSSVCIVVVFVIAGR